jgi:hypothetical protein
MFWYQAVLGPVETGVSEKHEHENLNRVGLSLLHSVQTGSGAHQV